MRLDEFLDALNAKFDDYVFTVTNGPKYIRISHRLKSQPESNSAYCFMDTDGNIYKAATWRTPAKGIRSTLATVNMDNVDPYGSWLYRR